VNPTHSKRWNEWGTRRTSCCSENRVPPMAQPAGRDGVSPLREQRERVFLNSQPRQRRRRLSATWCASISGKTGEGVALAPLTRLRFPRFHTPRL
jgi:hypothetical protein